MRFRKIDRAGPGREKKVKFFGAQRPGARRFSDAVKRRLDQFGAAENGHDCEVARIGKPADVLCLARDPRERRWAEDVSDQKS